MPLSLAQQGPRLYLVYRYNGYDNEQSLDLHRMKSVKVSTLGFERPIDFDLQQYDNDGRFGFGEGEHIHLSFKINKKAGAHILEPPLSTDQKIKEFEEHYEISETVIDTEQLT